MNLFKHLITLLALFLSSTSSKKITIDKVYHTVNDTNVPLFTEGMYEGASITLDLKTASLNGTPVHANAYLLRGRTSNNGTNEINPAPNDIWHYNSQQSTNSDKLERGFYRFIIERNGNLFPLRVTGSIHLIQSHGELAPDQYLAYIYYLIALCLVSIMIIIWLMLLFKKKTQIVGHHWGILILLICMFMSTAMDSVRLFFMNQRGELSIFLDYGRISMEVLKQSVARLLAILVSLGWGITLPSNQITTTMKKQLIGLGALYFIGASITEYCIYELLQRHILHSWCLLILPLSALLDSVIAVIVLQNLEIILEELYINKQYAKYKHYRNFSIALIILVILAMINTIIQSCIMRREHWFEYFDCFELVRSCFWSFLMILFVGVVMLLWRPTKAAKNYAYFKQIGQDEVDYLDNDFDLDGQVMRIGECKDVMRDPEIIFEIGDFNDDDCKNETERKQTFYGADGKRLEYELDLEASDDCELGSRV